MPHPSWYHYSTIYNNRKVFPDFELHVNHPVYVLCVAFFFAQYSVIFIHVV